MSPERSWNVRVEDILAHEYFGVSLPIIWRAIEKDLTPLADGLNKLLNNS